MPGTTDVAKQIISSGDMAYISTALIISILIVGGLLAALIASHRKRSQLQDRTMNTMAELQRKSNEREEVLGQKVANVQTALDFTMKSQERFQDTLEKRLQAGAEKMAQQEHRMREIVMTHLPAQEFRAYCEKHEQEHQRIASLLDDLKTGQVQVVASVEALGSRMEDNMRNVSGLLAKLVDSRQGLRDGTDRRG